MTTIFYLMLLSMSPWIQSNVLDDRQAEWVASKCHERFGRAAPAAALFGVLGVFALTPAFLTWRAGEVAYEAGEQATQKAISRWDQ